MEKMEEMEERNIKTVSELIRELKGNKISEKELRRTYEGLETAMGDLESQFDVKASELWTCKRAGVLKWKWKSSFFPHTA